MTQDTPNKNKAENANLKPDGEGQPPRPATEPASGEGSAENSKTETNPATGEPSDA